MACRDNLVSQILSDIKEIIGVNRTSARYLSGNRILLAINKDNPSLSTKENTIQWGRQLANKINGKYQSKLYGTLIYVNPNKYSHGTELTWEIPSKLIDAYEKMYDTEDSLPAIVKVGKYQSEVDKLTDRIRNLERSLSANKSDKVKKAEIEARIKTLKDRKEQLENEDKLADVIKYGNLDLEEVTKLLTKDKVSTSDLLYSNKIIAQWEKLPEYFSETDLMKVEGEYSPNVQAVNKIVIEAQNLRTTYTKVFNNAVLEMFKAQGVEATEKQIFGAKKEIGTLAANLLDISRTDDIIFQVTSKIIKDANYDTEQEVIKTVKEVDKLFDTVKKTSEYKSKGFDIFAQENDGKKTGMLITRFSQAFYKRDRELKAIAKKAKDASGWKAYFNWKKDNMILFDSRKLFNDIYNELDGKIKYSQEAITDHINDLKHQLGENGYKEYYDRLESKIELYKDDLEANKDRIDSLELDQVDKDTMLKEWILTNSPFVYAETTETGKVEKLGDKFIRPKGIKYTTEVPRKYTEGLKKTDWYDPKFEVVENNPALYNFYKYTKNKFDELTNYLPDYAIEDLQSNYLPEINKNIAELFSDRGIKGGMTGWYDKVISELTTNDISDISTAERDPITGKVLKTLPITMVGNKLNSEEKSYDIVKITKAFALMSLSYKHKAKIEDSIRIIEQVVNNATEMQTNAEGKQLSDAFGRPIETKDGLKNYKAQFEYAIESMVYGKRRIEEGISKSKKLLNTEEKAKKKLLEAKLKDANEEDKQSIQNEINALGSNVVASKSWDKVLEFAQIKGMGWNLFAPANNTVFAFVSNMIHAAGGEDFNYPQFLKAQSIMLNSVGKSISLDSYTSKTANKINKLMEDWNVVGEIDQAGYKSTAFESNAAKGLKKLAPYELTRRAEYLNQGTTFVAMMLGNSIKDKSGKDRNLWEAYDSDGKWKTDEFGPEISIEDKKKFKNRLEQVKKSIHGNYDPNSAVKIKKTTLGRAVMMFRSWVAEGFANRFESEKEDLLLGRKRKGRLITLKEQGLVKGPLYLLGQMANFLTFGGAFKSNLDQLSAVDKANMRKNAAEVLLYLSLYSLVLILKSVDSDDEDEKKALNALLNVSFRVQNDMAFFTSPLAFEKITQSSIPAMSIVTDAAKLVQAMQKTIVGDPYYKNGNHRGESRIKIALAKNLPLTTSIERAYQGVSKASE